MILVHGADAIQMFCSKFTRVKSETYILSIQCYCLNKECENLLKSQNRICMIRAKFF
jgi:hypothetical protein